jgi:hypothetical protein
MTSQQAKKAYAVFLQDSEDQDLLPAQFQGLHEMAKCPLFKGGGCPNCLEEPQETTYEHNVVELRNYLLNEKEKISSTEKVLLYALEAVTYRDLKLDDIHPWQQTHEVKIVKKKR